MVMPILKNKQDGSMKHLRSSVNSINLIILKAFGHSNGGLIWTYWLENYYVDYSDEIKIKKLMTLGTPYNFNESNVDHKTEMLNDFIKNRKKIPKNLDVYSVSGGKIMNLMA